MVIIVVELVLVVAASMENAILYELKIRLFLASVELNNLSCGVKQCYPLMFRQEGVISTTVTSRRSGIGFRHGGMHTSELDCFLANIQ